MSKTSFRIFRNSIIYEIFGSTSKLELRIKNTIFGVQNAAVFGLIKGLIFRDQFLLSLNQRGAALFIGVGQIVVRQSLFLSHHEIVVRQTAEVTVLTL